MYKGNFIVTSEGDEYPVGVLREANYANAEEIIAHLEIMIESNQREIQALKAELEGNKLFKENNKKDK